jgi:hypothetical protein
MTADAFLRYASFVQNKGFFKDCLFVMSAFPLSGEVLLFRKYAGEI